MGSATTCGGRGRGAPAVPTVFSVARRAGLRTGLLTQKGYVMGIADPSHVDRAELVPARAAIMTPDLVAALRLALRDAGIEEQCMVIVTADHGGIGRNHWESVSEVLTIPWMAIGLEAGGRPDVLISEENCGAAAG